MWHQSQATAAVFANKKLHDKSRTTIEELRHQLSDLPDNKLVEHIMWFGSSLSGTRTYWTKCQSELTNMITQLGFPSLFFTLSATNTEWLDFHTIMPIHSHSHSLNEHHMKIENVVQYPHIFATFMHHGLYIFQEEVIQKYLKSKDF